MDLCYYLMYIRHFLKLDVGCVHTKFLISENRKTLELPVLYKKK